MINQNFYKPTTRGITARGLAVVRPPPLMRLLSGKGRKQALSQAHDVYLGTEKYDPSAQD